MISSYVKLLIMICLTSLSQVLIKIGSGKVRTKSGLTVLIKTFLNPYIITGMVLVGAAPFLYFSALSRVPLNIAFSINGLGFIIVIILGGSVLKEKISVYHIAGGLLIFTGFLVWNIGVIQV